MPQSVVAALSQLRPLTPAEFANASGGRSGTIALVIAAFSALYLVAAPVRCSTPLRLNPQVQPSSLPVFPAEAFVAPRQGSTPQALDARRDAGHAWRTSQVDERVVAATFAGLSPLALEQPAGAYDSVVAMLQSDSAQM